MYHVVSIKGVAVSGPSCHDDLDHHVAVESLIWSGYTSDGASCPLRREGMGRYSKL